MERLELLNSPDECKRRLEEVPIVHADPNMDPSSDNAGEVDEEKQGYFLFVLVSVSDMEKILFLFLKTFFVGNYTHFSMQMKK